MRMLTRKIKVLGQCRKDRCGGPRGVESFNITCDRSVDPPFHVSWLVRNFPEKVRFTEHVNLPLT